MSNDSHCFVPGCQSGYSKQRKEFKKHGKRLPSLFSVKKDDNELLESWRKAIPRADKQFTFPNRVCELHFHENDLDKHFVHKMPDGTIQTIERERFLLKPGAVPSVFPNLPSYLSKQSQKRKGPSLRASIPKKKKEEASALQCTVTPDYSDYSKNFCLKDNMQNIKLPNDWWGMHSTPNYTVCARWNKDYIVERKIIVTDDLSVNIYFQEYEWKNNEKITCAEDLASIVEKVDSYVVCAGVNDGSNINCCGILPTVSKPGPVSQWCEECRKVRKKKLDTARRRHASKLVCKSRKLYQRIVSAKRKCFRLQKKVSHIQKKLKLLKLKCAAVEVNSLEKALLQFTSSQQEAIRACITAAKKGDKAKNGIRYTVEWIYECLLIRIKSRKAYEHLRSHKILALPSVSTLCRYIKKIKGAYGFQVVVFDLLKKKSAFMDPSDRRGTLIVDEMKVSSSIEFNRQTLQIEGFTDLGKYTERHKTGVKGDHVLVIMFQPFKGKWVQALACFLSKNNVSGTILHHLVIECTILLENAGYFVDVVTSDGASWNRKMWSQFGISLDNVSCSHPCNSASSSRRLWFVSDFPHLIKNVRNAVVNKKYMMTPDGPVKLDFWEAVVELDIPRGLNLKACPQLKYDHVHPKGYQKMNVAMAFQFFSDSVACAMQLFKGHPKLNGSDGCVQFIKKVNALVDAMNSRTPKTALKKDSSAQQVIKDFLEFLIKWERYAKQHGSNFISESTCYGLKITLKATLEILDFLIKEQNFQYLMTARLNQDSLERFFGMMRNACGSNDHPDSTTFLQVFRLISTYSLVKPPRGSNVSGGDILHSLLQFDDLEFTENRQEEFNRKLDELVKGENDIILVTSPIQDHDYCKINSSDHIIFYMAGYFAWRVKRLTKCTACQEALYSSEEKENEISKFTDLKEKRSLCRPSTAMHHLVKLVDQSTLNFASKGLLHVDSLWDILDDLEKKDIPSVGCVNEDHRQEFTQKILKICLIVRLHFVCNQTNSIDKAGDMVKQHRKLSKL